jgi:hypothetical protein
VSGARECTEPTRLTIRPCARCGYPPKTFISLHPKRYHVVCLACCESGDRARSRRVVTLQWNLKQKAATEKAK